jgi:hypothetical protein
MCHRAWVGGLSPALNFSISNQVTLRNVSSSQFGTWPRRSTVSPRATMADPTLPTPVEGRRGGEVRLRVTIEAADSALASYVAHVYVTLHIEAPCWRFPSATCMYVVSGFDPRPLNVQSHSCIYLHVPLDCMLDIVTKFDYSRGEDACIRQHTPYAMDSNTRHTPYAHTCSHDGRDTTSDVRGGYKLCSSNMVHATFSGIKPCTPANCRGDAEPFVGESVHDFAMGVQPPAIRKHFDVDAVQWPTEVKRQTSHWMAAHQAAQRPTILFLHPRTLLR